jgi:hypothetical protein
MDLGTLLLIVVALTLAWCAYRWCRRPRVVALDGLGRDARAPGNSDSRVVSRSETLDCTDRTTPDQCCAEADCAWRSNGTCGGVPGSRSVSRNERERAGTTCPTQTAAATSYNRKCHELSKTPEACRRTDDCAYDAGLEWCRAKTADEVAGPTTTLLVPAAVAMLEAPPCANGCAPLPAAAPPCANGCAPLPPVDGVDCDANDEQCRKRQRP